MDDPAPDYCPFCGARLPDGSGALRAHFGTHDDCRERYEAWGDEWSRAAVGDDRGSRGRDLLRTGLLGVVVLVIMAYSLLVTQQVLLGIIASGLVALAFWLYGTWRQSA
jgi:hypothetical protein